MVHLNTHNVKYMYIQCGVHFCKKKNIISKNHTNTSHQTGKLALLSMLLLVKKRFVAQFYNVTIDTLLHIDT